MKGKMPAKLFRVDRWQRKTKIVVSIVLLVLIVVGILSTMMPTREEMLANTSEAMQQRLAEDAQLAMSGDNGSNIYLLLGTEPSRGWRTFTAEIMSAVRDALKPECVAELLILRADMPRSLLACLNELMSNLAMVTSDRQSETLRRAFLFGSRCLMSASVRRLTT